MKYLGFLHSCNQNQPWANSVLIRILWEDITKAEQYGYNWKAIVYGYFSSRKKERALIYPNGETYSDWARISRQYKNVFLSINFDTYPKDKRQEFIKFVTEVVNFFYLHNKNIIVGTGNETYEKRGTVQKVLEVVSDVHNGVYRTHKNLPICFWNEKIRTTDEKKAVEELIKDSTIKTMCDYFGFQSLGTTSETTRKFIQLAKEKGFKILDVELGTKTEGFGDIKSLLSDEVEGVWILTPEIRENLKIKYPKWGDYALRIVATNEPDFVITDKDKRRIISYAKKFLEKEENEEMKLEKTYKKWSRGLPIKFIQKAINEYFMYSCEGVDPKPDWYPLDVDGIFGPLTEKAIKWYQELEGLEQQLGVVDEKTMESLVVNSSQVWSWFDLRWAYGER